MLAKWKLVVTECDVKLAELVEQSNHRTLAKWAADCAERVLPHFEQYFADDPRPRQAIEAAHSWVSETLTMSDARKTAFSAHRAARDAISSVQASSAARAAGHAAATAHVFTHALASARYAATAVRDAAESDAQAAARKEREWQYQHLLTLRED